MSVSATDLDFSKAIPCISAAQKFVLPVPAFEGGGEPLVFPAGHPKAGEPIVDWRGVAVGERGLVFHNDKDRVVQAARGDGEAIVIINQVDRSQAMALREKIAAIGANPAAFSLEQTHAALNAARQMGLGDQYNSDQGFMKSKLTAVVDFGGWGLFKRDDRDLCHALIMRESGLFAGPAGEPQPFEPGDAIVAQPDGQGGRSYRKIDGEVFLQTYRAPDGSALA